MKIITKEKKKEKNFSTNNKNIQNPKDIDRLISSYESAELNCKFDLGLELYKRFKAIGNIPACIEILEELKNAKTTAKYINRELEINLDKLNLLKDNNYLPPYIHSQHRSFNGLIKVKKVLCILNTSIPYIQNGYNIRSKYVVESLKNLGIKPVVLTRPGYPNDFINGLIKGEQDLIKNSINGITYYRCLPQLFMRYTPLKTYLKEYTKQINKVIAAEAPDIIQAASNYVNGLAALEAAREKKTPFLYEIRGFWELTTVCKEPLFKNSAEFNLAYMMESYLAHAADGLVTICEGLRKELINRGIKTDKIKIIPNGVDCKFFKPKQFNNDLGNKHNLGGKFIIGYIGSLTRYEGLQTLLPVIANLKKDGYKIKCLIIGTGDYRPILERITKELNIDKDVIYIDQIPHEQVVEYYSLFDLCVYPRINEEVTQMVTPLKPLEAMACGKSVIGSDLDAIREIIIPGINGLVYSNSEADLFQKIKLLYKNNTLRDELRLNARKWVVENRDWNKIAKTYQTLYDEVPV